ncbi:autotransporter outer membrane beta-barrel domain-containing protein [Pseudomonas sp. 3A(2025)]
MVVKHGVILNPIARALKFAVCLPVVVWSAQVWALQIREPVTVDANTLTQSYQIDSTGTLTANNATAYDITTISGARLLLNDSTVNALSRRAVQLNGSEAVITNSVLNGQTHGLSLVYNSDLLVPSRAQVNGGTITAMGIGVSISSFSILSLNGTTVSATGPQGIGMVMSGTAKAQTNASSITGQQSGIQILGDAARPGFSELALDASHVTGIEGAAIVFQANTNPAQANLHIGNGSTLTGGNGNILEADSGSTVNMTVDNSHLTGDVRVAEGGSASLTLQNRASLTGRLENVAQLALNSQGQWNMIENGQVQNLSMDGGAIQFGGATDYYRLSVANLSGNGIFKMDVDFGQAQNDFLDITGSATGNHTLLIASTGSDPLVDTRLQVVHAAAGDARFSLAGGAVDLGTWSYDLVEQEDNNWYLDTTTRTVSPGAASVIALFNTAPTVWYGELSTLRTRMGELRHHGAQPGLWMRSYANRFDVDTASGVGYRQNQQGVSLGADTALPLGDGQWLAGIMAGTSQSNLNLGRGTSGEVDSYYTGAYLTWLDSASGYYFDGVLKINRFDNASEVNLSDGKQTHGDYKAWGGGASLEFGRHLSLNRGWFVEPYAQVAALAVQGKTYTLDNGLKAQGDSARSLLAKAGATLGRDIALGQGSTLQPYVRAALAHEFVKTNQVRVNDNTFNNDLSGSRGELGAGVALALNERLSLHVDFEYSHGERIEQPWGANLGLRYDW